MNILPSDIINIFFIPKFLDKKYHKYSLQFKIDIYDTSDKYKNVLKELNKHIELFHKENLFNILPILNYFYKFNIILLSENNSYFTNYKINKLLFKIIAYNYNKNH